MTMRTRLSRLEGRSGTGAMILAVFDHDEAEKVREAASAHGEISPLIVVTGVPRRDAVLERVTRCSVILGKISNSRQYAL